jgi:hypothetical protein
MRINGTIGELAEEAVDAREPLLIINGNIYRGWEQLAFMPWHQLVEVPINRVIDHAEVHAYARWGIRREMLGVPSWVGVARLGWTGLAPKEAVTCKVRPGNLLESKTLTMDVTVRPVDEEHAQRLREAGFTDAPTEEELSPCSWCHATGFVGTSLCQACEGRGRS